MPYAPQVPAEPSPRTLHRFGRTLLLANLAVGLLLAAAVFLALRASHHAHGQRARTTTESLAAGLATAIASELKLIDNALLSVRADVLASGGLRRLDRGNIERILDDQKALVPWAAGMRIADADGFVRYGRAINPASLANVADRAYFIQARDQHADAVVISEPLLSRVDGQWGLAVARGLTDAEGRFAGVVYALLPVGHFEKALVSLELGEHGAATLRTASLQLVARVSGGRPVTSNVGSTKVSAELAQAIEASPNTGFYVSRTALDGVERTSAYQRVAPYPLMVLTGYSTDEFFEPWRREVWQLGSLVLLVIVVLAGASLMLFQSRRAELAMQRELHELTRAQGAMLDNDLVAIVRGRERKAVWVNRAMERIFGYEARELIGQTARMLHADDASYALAAESLRAMADGGQYRAQLQMRRKDGELIWVDMNGTMLSETDTLWMMADITALKRSEEQTRHAALHDPLTGLPNRLQLAQRLDAALDTAAAQQHAVALALVDLDGFKAVNDQQGHAAGDALLVEVARRLKLGVRGHDTVARWGGDEFVVALTSLGAVTDAMPTLQRLLADLQRPIALGDGSTASIGASIGVAYFPHDGAAAAGLLDVADQRMFRGKREGRNRIVDGDPPGRPRLHAVVKQSRGAD